MVGGGEGLVAAAVGFDFILLQALVTLICYIAVLVLGLRLRLNARSIGLSFLPLASYLTGISIAILGPKAPDFDRLEIAIILLVCILPALGSVFVAASRWFPPLLRYLFGLLAASSLALLIAIIVFSRPAV